MQIKTSNQLITYNPSFNTKTIAQISIESKCIWENLPEHDSLQCGNCKQINDGKIVEIYQVWDINEICIERKKHFEPVFFLTTLLIEILMNTKSKICNTENKEIWNKNTETIFTSLKKILNKIQQHKVENDYSHMTNGFPEFYSKNRCSISWKLKTNNNIKLLTEIKGNCLPIKINDKVVMPENTFEINFFEIENTNENTSSMNNAKFGKITSMILNLISIISSAKRNSIIDYNPNVQEAILLNALQKIESINPYLKTQCN